jgi:hypothetical protein
MQFKNGKTTQKNQKTRFGGFSNPISKKINQAVSCPRLLLSFRVIIFKIQNGA